MSDYTITTRTGGYIEGYLSDQTAFVMYLNSGGDVSVLLVPKDGHPQVHEFPTYGRAEQFLSDTEAQLEEAA